MGFLQPVSTLIKDVLSHLAPKPELSSQVSELQNILGDIYWITGEMSLAIQCQESAISATQHRLETLNPNNIDRLNHYYLKMLNIDSRLSLGLYAMDLWELERAKDAFTAVISLGQDTPHQAWADKAKVALSLTYAYQGKLTQAFKLATNCLSHFANQDQQSGRLAYFIQLLGQTYGQLGDLQQAKVLYQQALKFAETGHYLQVKAKAINGLAIIARQQKQMNQALTYHKQAIELCNKIGAKCDLANTYIECGHSHMFFRQPDTAQHYWQQALILYKDIYAHNQIRKITYLINTNSNISH